ncbi:MAG: YihA family ribosome biogenesis GTP-binding protein [Gammaproteobacteria bacterium]|nr:YihA family ribosome biogenesis GTP-binding protein [Gammaproteobacteria bacterium]|tara:strand:+ start:1098 stop:1718 length:621 start_codon:yes stop_codon:yes gene_type:complete
MMTERLDYKNAHFLTSASTLSQCPPDDALEVAFTGRSNAGKSSAINALTRQPKLARTSKTPGRTQLLNYFMLADKRYLVDLPGFGYAKVPPAMKEKWQKELTHYLEQRRSLQGIILLMDIRHLFKDSDRMMIDWAVHASLPLHILLTKADKLKGGAARNVLFAAQKELQAHAGLISVQLFSALKNEGIETLRTQLDQWLNIDDNSV